MFEDGFRERRDIRRMQSGTAAVAYRTFLRAAWTARVTHFAVSRILGSVSAVISAAGFGAALLRGALSGAEQCQVPQQKRADNPESHQPQPGRCHAHGMCALPDSGRGPLLCGGFKNHTAVTKIIENVDL